MSSSAAAIACFLLMQLFSVSALAQAKCIQMFKKPALEQLSLEDRLHHQAVELGEARNVAQANEATYNLVLTANQIIEQLAHHIVQVRNRPMAERVRQNLVNQVNGGIDQLSTLFGLDGKLILKAMEVRAAKITAEYIEKYEAHQQRRAIGFGRDQSYEEFHQTPSEKSVAGFERPRISDELSDLDVPVKMGFDLRFAEQSGRPRKGPLGFGRSLKDSKNEAGETQPMGFVHFPAKEGRPDQIVLDLESGFFEKIRSEQD